MRSLFVPSKPIDLSLTDEEQSILDNSLQEYKDIGDEIWNYNLDNNLVPALVKAIADPIEFEGFNISSHKYIAKAVPTLIEKDVEPDLKKLGLEGLLPKLQEELTKEYKKDLPDPEIHKIADEDMFLYVPDFSNKIDEKRSITEKGISQEKHILDSAIEATKDIRTGKINEQVENIKSKQKEKSLAQNIEEESVSQDK